MLLGLTAAPNNSLGQTLPGKSIHFFQSRLINTAWSKIQAHLVVNYFNS